MKKVYNNAVYDTETAKMLGGCDNGYGPNDFDYFSEALYVTKSGNYFIHGEGGANSRYGVWSGNNGRPGEKIMPVSYDDAKKWAEKNLDGDEYIRAFGSPEEGTFRVAATLSLGAKNKLDRIRSESGETVSEVIERLIEAADAERADVIHRADA